MEQQAGDEPVALEGLLERLDRSRKRQIGGWAGRSSTGSSRSGRLRTSRSGPSAVETCVCQGSASRSPSARAVSAASTPSKRARCRESGRWNFPSSQRPAGLRHPLSFPSLRRFPGAGTRSGAICYEMTERFARRGGGKAGLFKKRTRRSGSGRGRRDAVPGRRGSGRGRRAPDRDGAAPDTDGGTPSRDGVAPSADGDTPARDGAAPFADGETPARDGEAPDADGGRRPGTERLRTQTERRRPGTEKLRPQTEGRRPGMERLRPQTEGRRTGTERLRPQTERLRLGTERLRQGGEA
jgi:hypothetical protein